MKNGWTTRKLGDVCVTIQDGAHESPKKQFDAPADGRFLYITSKNIRTNYLDLEDVSYVERDFHNRIYPRCQPRVGDVLLTKDGANTGNVALNTIDEPFSLLSSVCLIKTNHTSLEPAFLCYYLQSPDGLKNITGQMTGAAIKRIILRNIRLAAIPLPPLPEQRRIVGILDEAFEGIATAKDHAERNLHNARAIFESHLQSVFAERGEGWVDTALGDVCGFVRGPFGGSLKKSTFVADGYAVYEQQHAIYDQFDDVRYFIGEAKFKEMRRFELLPNDLIMSCSGTMGRVAVVPKGIKRGIINQALLKLTPTDAISNTFLKSWMESEAFQDALKEYSGGAAIQNVASVKVLKEIRIPLPSVKEQERVVTRLNALREETQHLESVYERKIAALEALKKSLLNQAFRGNL